MSRSGRDELPRATTVLPSLSFVAAGTRIGAILRRTQTSKFARSAVWLLLLNLISKAVGFLGSTYAASCLGPVNLGASALVQTTAQQVTLLFNGGFDNVAVRTIADLPGTAVAVTRAVVQIRLLAAAVLGLAWCLGVWLFAPPAAKAAWYAGVALLFIFAGGVVYAFQGLERLPVQTLISTLGTVCNAALYFSLFRPGVSLGSDLFVVATTGVITLVIAWWAFRRSIGVWPVGFVAMENVRVLIRQSWRYWLLTVVVYSYTNLQISMVAYFLSLRDAGIVRSALLLASGLEVLYNSINSLLLPRLVAWRRISLELMWRKQAKLVLLWLVFGGAVAVAAIAIAPIVFERFLGPRFSQGIRLFQLFALSRFVVFVGQIYCWGLAAASLDSAFLWISAIGAVCSLTLNLLALPKFGSISCGFVSLIAESVIVVAAYTVLKSHVGNRWRPDH